MIEGLASCTRLEWIDPSADLTLVGAQRRGDEFPDERSRAERIQQSKTSSM